MVEVLADPAVYEFTGGSAPPLEELGERYRLLSPTEEIEDGEVVWRKPRQSAD